MSKDVQQAPMRRMLGFEEVRQKLGVSARKARYLIAEAWFPDPIELGPRCLRWVDAEIDEALAARAPRRPEPASEPAQLLAGKKKRAAT